MYKKFKRHLHGGIAKLFYNPFRSSNKAYYDLPTVWIDNIFKDENIYIVQVGSNDGISGDPLHPLIVNNKNWRALFIEPVPTLFEKLKIAYKNQSRFKFENVAINDGSSQPFFSVKDSAKAEIPDLPEWFDQLGSFKKDHITKHLNGILEPFIEVRTIKGTTLPEILNFNEIKNFDLLHIDVEGYDWVVLSQLDLNFFTPDLILFEHKHLETYEKKESIKHLKHHKYFVYELGSDFICIKKTKKNRIRIKELKGKRII